MATQLDPLVEEIRKSIAEFQKSIPGVQKAVFDSIVNDLNGLDTVNGNIAVSVRNIRLINTIKTKLMKTILSDDYKSGVKNYLTSFDGVTKIQNKYFKELESTFTRSKLGEEIKSQSVDSVVQNLTERGIDANIVSGVEDILKQSMTTGGTVAQLQDRLRDNLMTSATGPGSLERYTKQITTDALNQYSAQYTQTVSADLGFVWFRYTGSLLETSREFCEACRAKDYIHITEFEDVIKGNFPEFEQAKGKINPKTGLPEGMIPETTPATFPVLRGGYNCGHQLRPVKTASVPKALRDLFPDVAVSQKKPIPPQEPTPLPVPTATVVNAPTPAPTPTPVKAAKGKKKKEAPKPIVHRKTTFTPAKTIAEADEFIKNTHGLTYQPTPKGRTPMTLELKNMFNEQLHFLLSNYDLPPGVTFENIGTLPLKEKSNAMVTTNMRDGTSVMELNDSFNDGTAYDEKKARFVKDGWFPKGADNRESTIHHEFGHTLTALDLGQATRKFSIFRKGEVAPIVKELKAVQKKYNEARSEFHANYTAEKMKILLKTDIDAAEKTKQINALPLWKDSDDFLSDYGEHKNSIDEFVAESFASSIHSKKPSKYALEVRGILDKYYHKDRPKTP